VEQSLSPPKKISQPERICPFNKYTRDGKEHHCPDVPTVEDLNEEAVFRRCFLCLLGKLAENLAWIRDWGLVVENVH